MSGTRSRIIIFSLAWLAVSLPAAAQEWSPLKRGTDNVEIMGHVVAGAI